MADGGIQSSPILTCSLCCSVNVLLLPVLISSEYLLRGKLHLQNVKLIKTIKLLLQIYARLFISKNIACHWDYLGPLHIFFPTWSRTKIWNALCNRVIHKYANSFILAPRTTCWQSLSQTTVHLSKHKKNTHNYQVKLKLKPQVFVTKLIPVRQYVGKT